jgi:hypothetical protein
VDGHAQLDEHRDAHVHRYGDAFIHGNGQSHGLGHADVQFESFGYLDGQPQLYPHAHRQSQRLGHP